MDWHEYFFGIADAVAAKSKDLSVQVGAVIIGPSKQIVSTGFNGLPFGVSAIPTRSERPQKYLYTEHAERNAIFLAARHGIKTVGCEIYITGWLPCADCTRAIIQSGIVKIHIRQEMEAQWDDRWEKSFEASRDMIVEAGIHMNIVKIMAGCK